MIKYIDLFAGIGGIRLGTVQALEKMQIPSKCILSSEINEKACETYELNFGEQPQGDIKKITDIGPFDFLLAGFPCQPFSYAGKKRGFGDTRGTLFFEIERILKKYRPKAFLLENVRGLRTHDHGRTFETIMSKLHDLGYGATPAMSLVTNLGAADSHKYKSAYQQLSIFDNIKKSRCTVGEILESDIPEKYVCSPEFTEQLHSAVGENLSKLHGYRLIDYRGGQSLHSWELGKKLTLEQIKTFYKDDDIVTVITALTKKAI